MNSRIEELTFAPDGGEAICGGFNPFGLGSISAECAAYIAVDGTNRAGVDQTILEASLSGPLLELPAGELRAAFGVFYKKDEYFYSADPVATVFLPDGRPDIIGFNASDDIEGEDDNTDLYVEASIPLLADRPGVRSLEAVVGYRYSDYASAGGADAYKAELLYRPVDALRVRSSYQRAVRAPSVGRALFAAAAGVIFLSRLRPPRPLRGGSAQRNGPDQAQVEALCLAQGLPPELLPDYDNTSSSPRGSRAVIRTSTPRRRIP